MGINGTELIYDVIIIGGGASGLMCASYLHYLNPEAKVLILERNSKLGAKVLITGNGRCNLTNTSIKPSDYNTDCEEVLQSVLREFTVEDTMDYMENVLGIHLTDRNNLIYPYSLKSSTVVDAFMLNLEGKADIELNQKVIATSVSGDVFTVRTENNSYNAHNIVFAGGGSAAPKTGSDGNIYRLILPYTDKSAFTQVMPSLVQLKTLETDTAKIAGTRVRAAVSLVQNDEILTSSSGEMMFTDYGVSGICIFDISGHYNSAIRKGGKNIKLTADLMPGEDALEVLSKRQALFPDRDFMSILMGFYTRELSEVIIRRSRNSAESIADTIKNFTFTVTGTMGFDNAQVTMGGLNVGRLDNNCRLTDGVYVIGEALNVDGPCGGYNLQWAWSSAVAAAAGINGGKY